MFSSREENLGRLNVIGEVIWKRNGRSSGEE